MRDKMLAFMKERKYCVISTIHPDGRPESAFVAFSNKELEIFIGTSNESRKFRNLAANPSIAIVIADEQGEVQYEGEASVVAPDEFSTVHEQHVGAIPGSDKYRKDPSQEYIRITPTWVRFIDHTANDQVEEFTEFAA